MVDDKEGDVKPSAQPSPVQPQPQPQQQQPSMSTSQASNGSSEPENVFHRLTRHSKRYSDSSTASNVDASGQELPVATVAQLPGKIRASTSSAMFANSTLSSSHNSSSTLHVSNRSSAGGSPAPCFNSYDQAAPVVEYVAQASGHTRTVLSVTGDNTGLLFTGSKDRTAKAWDLMENRELFTLTGHPDSVVKVLYHPSTRMLFTVAGACVRVWDCRCFQSPVAELENPGGSVQCTQTLLSSGLAMEGAGHRNELNRMGRSDGITDAAFLTTPSTDMLLTSANADVSVQKFYFIFHLFIYKFIGKSMGFEKFQFNGKAFPRQWDFCCHVSVYISCTLSVRIHWSS